MAQQMLHGQLVIGRDFNKVVDKSVDRSASCARFSLKLKFLLQEEDLHDMEIPSF